MKTFASQSDAGKRAKGLFRRILGSLGECRSAHREPSAGRVTLNWRDRYGEGFAYGTCRDISHGGIGIECLEPIPLKAPVTVRIKDDTTIRPAVIRYRSQRGAAYMMGLEFTTPAIRREDWRRDEMDMATDGMTW